MMEILLQGEGMGVKLLSRNRFSVFEEPRASVAGA